MTGEKFAENIFFIFLTIILIFGGAALAPSRDAEPPDSPEKRACKANGPGYTYTVDSWPDRDWIFLRETKGSCWPPGYR